MGIVVLLLLHLLMLDNGLSLPHDVMHLIVAVKVLHALLLADLRLLDNLSFCACLWAPLGGPPCRHP